MITESADFIRLDRFAISVKEFVQPYLVRFFCLRRPLEELFKNPRYEKAGLGRLAAENFPEEMKTLQKLLQEASELNQILTLPQEVKEDLGKAFRYFRHGANIEERREVMRILNAHPSGLVPFLLAILQEGEERFTRTMTTEAETLIFLKGAAVDVVWQKGQSNGIAAYPTCFLDKLSDQVSEFLSDKSKSKAGFLVNFWGDLAGHFCPIYMEKQGEKVAVFVSDSIGFSDYSEKIADLLHRCFSERISQIYLMSIGRQTDHTSCGVFSLTDLIDIAEYRGDFFAKVQEHIHQSLKTDGGTPVSLVNPPLANMLRMTQSLKKAQAFLRERKDLMIFSGDSQEGIPLEKYWERNSVLTLRQGRIQKQNLSAAIEMSKICELVLGFPR